VGWLGRNGAAVPYDPSAFLDMRDWSGAPRMDVLRFAIAPAPTTGGRASPGWALVNITALGVQKFRLPQPGHSEPLEV